ncbi:MULTISPECIES: SLC13 family permease [unclassified Streptococcus]|uniref:SLC13 family permease n=1 Tax=unclassified Streptococcus TaxID=2608887 RepID=UPI00359ED031
MKHLKRRELTIIISLALLFAIWNPLGFSFNQTVLVSSLIITVASWATDAVHKSLACLFLLASFIIFGQMPPIEIFGFLWGDMNLLIMSTTLLSMGMMKTGLIQAYVEKWLATSANNTNLLLLVPYALGLVLIILIPQAFVRVIILGTILDGLLQARTTEEMAAKRVLMMNGFIGVSIAYMLVRQGDILLNLSAISFGGQDVAATLTSWNWFKLMSLPVVVTAAVTILVTKTLFKKELSAFSSAMLLKPDKSHQSLSANQQRLSLLVIAGVVLSWTIVGWHQLPAWLPVVVGVVIFFATGILTKDDLSAINPHFILFLTTIFSIGKVLGQAGITGLVFEQMKVLIPSGQSPIYLLVIIVIIMLFHVLIGSSVATMSVVLPIVAPLMAAAGYQAHLVTLMTYTLVNIHFLLPFHHAIILLGIGKGYYPDHYMLRYGIVMTVLTPLLLLGIYWTWWRLF